MTTPPKYVNEVAFDVRPETWNAAKEEIRGILIGVANRGGTISYSELVATMKTLHLEARETRLFALLGQVSQDEHEKGHPLLSVLVVHKSGDIKPGSGFFELATSLGRDTRNQEKAWVEETTKVYSHWKKSAPAHV